MTDRDLAFGLIRERAPRKARVFWRLVLTTIRNGGGAPLVDQLRGRLVDGREWQGWAIRRRMRRTDDPVECWAFGWIGYHRMPSRLRAAWRRWRYRKHPRQTLGHDGAMCREELGR